MADHIIPQFISGVHNLIDDENIPFDAAQDSYNWQTLDGAIRLVYGKTVIGAEGVQGSVTGEIFGYKVDGTKIHWRKIGTKIQYLNGTTWTDVVTGLTSSAEYTFSNYASLAGNFTFAIGVDGIYKMHNANPASSISLYNSAKNFKGHAFIDRARMVLWNRPEDKTGFYGSYIDAQNGTVYTTVAAEATTSLTGTLAFKAAGATRNCFGVTITITATGEVYTDNYDGVLTGTSGGTGTINYISGAYTLSNAGVGTAGYQWEDSNIKGITDFTKSTPRIAGEGFIVPQDEGGDAILTVKIGIDGAYHSIKSQSAYRLAIDNDDLGYDNQVFRRDIGVPYFRAATSTGKGIVFINTANKERPELTILQLNPLGGNVEPVQLFPHFKFSDYTYDECVIDTYGKFVLVSCKSSGATSNNITLLCDVSDNKVDITSYAAKTFAKNGISLYMGSSITQSVYEVFSGFDDDSALIENFWISKGEMYKANSLKKYRRQRLMGLIDASQSYEVYISYDDGEFGLVGTVLGNASYVDTSSPQSIGSSLIGAEQIGGDSTTTVYPYFLELKVKTPKFRKRTIKLVALGYGYVSVDSLMDFGVLVFEQRIPKRYRVKQNVSLDGATTDMANPEF